MEDIDIAKIIAVYEKIHATIQEKERQQAEELDGLKKQLKLIEDKCLAYFASHPDMQSFKSVKGTISRTLKTTYTIVDTAALDKFIVQHNAPFLLQRRVNKTNLEAFIDENPAIDLSFLHKERKYTVHFTPSRKKPD